MSASETYIKYTEYTLTNIATGYVVGTFMATSPTAAILVLRSTAQDYEEAIALGYTAENLHVRAWV